LPEGGEENNESILMRMGGLGCYVSTAEFAIKCYSLNEGACAGSVQIHK
jgi:hypothetical protein